MSKFLSGLLGAGALLVTVGGAQFAVGQNMPNNQPIASPALAAIQSSMVNRATKADQSAGMAREVSGMSATNAYITRVSAANELTVVVRVPRAERQESKIGTSKSSRRPVACEASASVLTDIAKLMESARCVT